MAAHPRPRAAEEEEKEPVENPRLPSFRFPSSGVPDPVVQTEIPPAGQRLRGGIQPTPPTTGFNFRGVGANCGTPSDSNGSVGNDQFVETVNCQYQVWRLDRATSVATSVLGPADTNALWAGFGGPCEGQNAGDPIVLFDKLANRWLISQFTVQPDPNGLYYQCVAVSTTPDALGTYGRWAFALPFDTNSGQFVFGDYPHFGVWTDAYYMMAHGFGTGYLGAVFSAMDRPRMLASDPAATWQAILDPAEGGHMPADVDGFAPPPTNAPGIFLSLHGTGMAIYRMTVDFALPANTVNEVQATVPIAPSNGACPAGACVPQPGSAVGLDALGDRLMFRAAYRNLIDHESLVVTHSVDPSIAGLAAAVRWYEFHLSGAPSATCPEYPCLYQQGTIADVANGRSRWMASVAMDSAENMLIGYTTTGVIDRTDNHSSRYTGRAKDDPPGTMTAPETTIVTGNRNASISRWGDYSSMSVDPFDDCTFWFVSQYYLGSATAWSTQVASARFPAGSGAGECPASNCIARPASAPVIGTATVPGNNQITVNWTGITPAPGAYAIERATGACGSEGLYQPLAAVPGSASSYTDTTVQGGLTYSYRVIAAADAAGRCQALVPSGYVNATATGTCSLRPLFAGVASASSNNSASCGINLSWASATTSCPLTATMRYNIFRGSVPDFVPSAANRIATCITGTGYLDTTGITGGITYYYLVRAEDNSTGNGGSCGGGNEEANGVVVSGTAYGAGTQATPGTWTDGGGDRTSFLLLNAASAGNSPEQAWRIVTTANDPGANQTPGGAYAYRNAGPGPTNIYSVGTCAEMQTPLLPAGAATVNLQYWERHQIEYHWDGVAVEYSRNGGAWTSVPAPSNSAAAGCAATDDTGDWQTLECTQNPPINRCGYADTTSLYNGPLAGGNNCNNYATGAVTSYAHRCHQIAGLAPGDTIQFRWRFTSDPGAEFAGFYLDDIAVTNILLPNGCTNGCTSLPPGVVPNRLFAAHQTGGGVRWVWTSLDPTGAWNLHATVDPTAIPALYSNAASIVAPAVPVRTALDSGGFPIGYYQVYGSDCSGSSVP